MQERDQKDRLFLSGILCAVLALAVVWIGAVSPASEWVSAAFGQCNLISLAVGSAASLVLSIGLNRLMRGGALTAKLPRGLAWGCAAVLSVFLIVSMNHERYVFATNTHYVFLFRYPKFLRVLVVCALSAIFVYWLRGSRALTDSAPTIRERRLFAALSGLLAVLVLAAKYMPNVLNEGGSLYHFHAYFNSIYNVAHGAPFSPDVTSIYGHYAFFYAPFILLARAVGFTNEVKLTIFLLAALCAIVAVLYAYAISVFVKNALVRAFAVVSVCLAMLSLDIGLYVQLTPHRLFPYAVFAALTAFWYTHPKQRGAVTAAGYIAAALGVVWSTECGAISALAWAALGCCSALQSRKPSAWLHAAGHLAAAAAAVVGGYCLTNAFNLAMGGGVISVSDFLFPLMTGSYMEGYLEEPLYGGPAAWMSILLVLFFLVFRGFSGTVLCTSAPAGDDRAAAYFMIGVLGIGSLSYAFNRPAHGNFYIMMPLMSLAMGMIVQSALPEIRSLGQAAARNSLSFARTLRGGVGLVTLCVLFLTSTLCVANYGARQTDNKRFRDEYSMNRMSDVVLEGLPKDLETAAMGRGAVEIFASLGLDTIVHVMDYSDITIDPDDFVYADDQLAQLEGKALMICSDNMDMHREANLEGYRSFMETHTFAGTITPPSEVEELVFEYYVPAGYDFSTDEVAPLL